MPPFRALFSVVYLDVTTKTPTCQAKDIDKIFKIILKANKISAVSALICREMKNFECNFQALRDNKWQISAQSLKSVQIFFVRD